MGAKLHQEMRVGTVPVREMQDGQVAVITEWDGTSAYNGHAVQRYKGFLVRLGMTEGYGWGEVWRSGSCSLMQNNCRVRILEPGELIEVT